MFALTRLIGILFQIIRLVKTENEVNSISQNFNLSNQFPLFRNLNFRKSDGEELLFKMINYMSILLTLTNLKNGNT
jgi:hypothetical protein